MTESQSSSAEELARQERLAAGRIDMSGYRIPLLGGAALIILSWILPYSGSMTGIDLALITPRSVDYGISLPERMFVWLCALGPVLLNILGYLRKSTHIAQIAWFFTGISMFFSLFAVWMRQTRDQGFGVGPGLVLAALAVLFVVYGLYNVVTMRTDEQEEIAERRRQEVIVDPVAEQQRAKFGSSAQTLSDDRGPIDDRRGRRRKN